MRLNGGPIFVGGLERSGKTLMRLSLSSHPSLAMTRRTYMWPHFYGRFGDLAIPNNFERCLAAMLQHKPIRALSPDPARLRREFRHGDPSYARLFALVHQQYAKRVGKPRWGDQTGSIERYADQIFAAYPSAKMIHMIRDPRDQYAVSQSAKLRSRGGIGGASAQWCDSADLARRNRARFIDCYLVVRYEDLISRREETLRDICAFIGEEFVPGMVSLEHAIRFGDEPREDEPNDASVRLTPRELVSIQRLAGTTMQLYGYALCQIRLSLRDQLLLSTIDYPANRVRAMVWRTVDILRQRFPAYLGRKRAAVLRGYQPGIGNRSV